MSGYGRATAVAHANIALAKYWGKADVTRNLPAVPSLSLTLDELYSITSVEFASDLTSDEITLDGEPLTDRPRERVVTLLDRVRELAQFSFRARVRSKNQLPTAAGLASSASGFAALALAASHAAGLSLGRPRLSALARASSASAARSVFGGFVSLDAGADSAEQLVPGSHFPLAMVVTITESGPKAISSTEGMLLTARTSPYYEAWTKAAPGLYEQVKSAILARNFGALGEAAEQSALLMHSSMWGARPAVIYFTPTTLAVMERVRALRSSGTPAFYTMDAGPHVKVLTMPDAAKHVANELQNVPGVLSTLMTGPGPDAHILPDVDEPTDGGFD